MKKLTVLLAMLVLGLTLSACEGIETKAEYPHQRRGGDRDAVYGQREGMFGKGGIGLFNSKKETASTAGITVNSYLWRSTLDTLSFMPIANADPFGGTILTDWYEAPNAKGERVKVNAFIMGRELRTDALKLTLFRQVAGKNGQWQNATVDPKTVTNLENAILTRARQLKVSAKEEE